MSKRDSLAAELSTLRVLAGLSGRKMAVALGVNAMTEHRVERGETLPSRDLVVKWLNVAGADEVTRVRVLWLLHEAAAEASTWSRHLDGRSHLQDEMAQRDQASTHIRNYQSVMIPGLLQTPEYSRAVFELPTTATDTDIPTALAARLDRQSVLHAPGKRFEFLLAEHVLKWAPADGVLTAQLDRLVQLSALDSVEIGVVPAATRLVSWSPFVFHETAEGETYVAAELNHGEVIVRRPADVETYVNLYNRLHAAALTGDAATELIIRRTMS